MLSSISPSYLVLDPSVWNGAKYIPSGWVLPPQLNSGNTLTDIPGMSSNGPDSDKAEKEV